MSDGISGDGGERDDAAAAPVERIVMQRKYDLYILIRIDKSDKTRSIFIDSVFSADSVNMLPSHITQTCDYDYAIDAYDLAFPENGHRLYTSWDA